MFEDVRFGVRMLARNPGVTGMATITLALGIGGCTAIFSVVNTVLFKPLPVADPGRLVCIWANSPSRNLAYAFAAYSTYAEWKSGSPSFESLSAYAPASATLLVGNEPEQVDVLRVNASFFPMLGIRPVAGRSFLAEEDQPGAPRVAMLAYGIWERRFGRDPNIVGRRLSLDREGVEVVGVLPRAFVLPNRVADVYVPIASSTVRGAREAPTVGVYGRLKPGIPIEHAQAEIDVVSRRLAAAYPEMKGRGAQIWRARDFAVREVRLSLLILFGAVGLVLLIACANVANLLLVRASVRQREIALRAALGAGLRRIIRQLLTESVLFGLIGGAAGLAVAGAGIKLLPRYGPERIPFLKDVAVDGSVLTFAVIVSLLTGIGFGLAPALAGSRARIYETLKEGGIAVGESRMRNRFRSALVVIEVALALLLTISATLMARSLMRLQTTNPGFDAEGVLTASLTLPSASYPKAEQRVAFYQQVLDRLNATPGAQAASMVNLVPFGGSNTGVNLRIEGQPPPRPEATPVFWHRIIDPGYFRLMRIPLIRGREFTPQDAGSPLIAIINQTMARRFWAGADPLGKRFGIGSVWFTVVGIVGDVKFTSLTKDAEPEFYEPYSQRPVPAMVLAVRAASDPLRLAAPLRQAVLETDHSQPVSRVAVLAQSVSDSVGTPRLSASLLAAFGATALVLSAIGIYGVISFSVTRRTREIGVRLALGATRPDVMRMVVRQAVTLAATGVAAGNVAALLLTRFLEGMLFGVKAVEPFTYLAASALLIGIAALAAYLPAQRAGRLSLSAALRHE
jgi:putative ABC transport system permease protein